MLIKTYKQWCSTCISLKSFEHTLDQHVTCVWSAVRTLPWKSQQIEILCSNNTFAEYLFEFVFAWLTRVFWCFRIFSPFSLTIAFFFSLSSLDDLVCTYYTFSDDTIWDLFQTYPHIWRFVLSELFPLLRKLPKDLLNISAKDCKASIKISTCQMLFISDISTKLLDIRFTN